MSSFLLNAALSICFVAGKSGGHLLPCITMANQIKQQNPTTQIYLFSSGSQLDHTIADKHKNITHMTPTTLDNPPYQQPWLLPWFGCKTAWCYLKTVCKLWQLQPTELISFGGFISIPVCLAAKTVAIPFKIYELNVQPGKANKFLSKFTDTVYTCFHATQQYFPNHKCVHFDYPIRFNSKDLQYNKQKLLDAYHLNPNRMTILILGGSQGSILLNEIFKKMIDGYPEIEQKIQVIHQTGATDSFDYTSFYRQKNIPAHVFDYCEKLQDFYNLADIIICRAGAGTLFEIKFFGKKCITIPHETQNTNHQIDNVLQLQKEFPSQFKIIKQSDFTPQILWSNIF